MRLAGGNCTSALCSATAPLAASMRKQGSSLNLGRRGYRVVGPGVQREYGEEGEKQSRRHNRRKPWEFRKIAW